MDFNKIPVNTVSSQLKEGVFGVVPKLSPLVVTLLSEEATGSVIEANFDPRNSRSDVRSFDVLRWRTRPGPEWTVRSFAIGHRVPYAAGGASLTGEKHVPARG